MCFLYLYVYGFVFVKGVATSFRRTTRSHTRHHHTQTGTGHQNVGVTNLRAMIKSEAFEICRTDFAWIERNVLHRLDSLILLLGDDTRWQATNDECGKYFSKANYVTCTLACAQSCTRRLKAHENRAGVIGQARRYAEQKSLMPGHVSGYQLPKKFDAYMTHMEESR